MRAIFAPTRSSFVRDLVADGTGQKVGPESRFSYTGEEENPLPDLLSDLLRDFPRNLLLSYFGAPKLFC